MRTYQYQLIKVYKRTQLKIPFQHLWNDVAHKNELNTQDKFLIINQKVTEIHKVITLNKNI